MICDLPGVSYGTTVRTFAAPQAMGVNFHEVLGKSALNRVRGARYGFGWTINPYRGCTHACVFCLLGETPILMADGSRPLATIGEGAAIYGTVLDGSQRRFETTRVLARWQTRSWAYGSCSRAVARSSPAPIIASSRFRAGSRTPRPPRAGCT